MDTEFISILIGRALQVFWKSRVFGGLIFRAIMRKMILLVFKMRNPRNKLILQGQASFALLDIQEVSNNLFLTGGNNRDLSVQILGSNNVVELNKCNTIHLRITIRGNNCSVHVKSIRAIRDCEFILLGDNSSINIDENSGCNGGRLIVAGGKMISVGKNVMIADRTELWASDTHSIIDNTTGKRINHDSSITIEDNVWIGTGVRICKGVSVGEGSVIGLGSIVTHNIPANVIAAGVPAKIIRENISWSV